MSTSALQPFIGGIQEIHKRSLYPEDQITIINGYKKESCHKFEGKITSQYYDSDDSDIKIIHLDDIIKIRTVSEDLRNKTTNVLNEEKKVTKNIGILSGLAGGLIGLAMWRSPFSIISFGLGIYGAWRGYNKSTKYSNELKNWENKVNEYRTIRTNIPKESFRYLYIFNNNLKDKFLTKEEAYKIWSEDILDMFDYLEKHSSSYDINIIGARAKAEVVKKILKGNPLENKYVYYFEKPEYLLETSGFTKKIDAIFTQYFCLEGDFDAQKTLLQKAEQSDLNDVDKKYASSKLAIDCVSTGAHILNYDVCNHNCSCRDGLFSKTCSQGCYLHECQSKALNKFVGHVGIDALTSVVHAPINSAINDEKYKIKAEYAKKLYDQESIFDEKVAALLPSLFSIFKNYRNAFNIHVSYSLDK